MILVSLAGENSIVVIPGANHRVSPSDIASQQARFAAARFALLQLEIPLETVIAAAAAAKRAGARVMLDPAPAPDELHPDLLGAVDILTPNESEAAALAGYRASRLEVDDARAIAQKLRASGPGMVIIKLGAQGCLLVTAEGANVVPAPQVGVVDSTAAGDVFNGALAVALDEGATPIDACRFATAAASLSVTRLGAQASMPDQAELHVFQPEIPRFRGASHHNTLDTSS